ncbi:hypothetical protein [Caulobacter endophyticus]|uniref:hypothetical protein n=1 Tax=Caulobacter endophyticus TaxID=2172652 RepID=UPI00240FC356|nr:hypothetical protein [Caulobacter endophyticus]MDG2528596.1 hypothetical protein [Caulobacter endophyticus]
MSIGRELLNVPMGDMIRQMAFAIAEGQIKLDANSIEVAEMMGGLQAVTDDKGVTTFDDSRIFFGYDLMSPEDAVAYIEADNAISGGDTKALLKVVEDQQTAILANGEASSTLIRVPTRLSMLELGFSPTFYQFVDTIIEVKIAIKITHTSESSVTSRYSNQVTTKGSSFSWSLFRGNAGASNTTQVTTSQVDATYSSKYSYSAEGSSLLRTKLVPIPQPAILEERIRRQLDEEVERRRRLLDINLVKAAEKKKKEAEEKEEENKP